VSYTGRTYDEGKKIRASDGVKALWQMFQSKFLDPQFTDHAGLYALTVLSRAAKRNRWLLRQVEGYLGQRLLEAGAGIGNLSAMLLSRERLLLVDREPLYAATLRNRFRLQKTVTVEQADLAAADVVVRWRGERLDTILSVNLLEHFPADGQVLRNFHEILTPGGHCIVVVPAGHWLYTKLDKHAGHERRYSAEELRQKLAEAGFEVVHSQAFGRAGSIAWTLEGRLLRRRRLSPRELLLADRCWGLSRALDRVLPVPASSLLMVGRKKGT
jgi:SAM-dependent methyltransferase